MRHLPNVTYCTQELIRMMIDAESKEHVELIWDHVHENKFDYCLDDLKIMLWVAKTRIEQFKNNL